MNVFHCTFGEDWDVNYDGWPDRWVRKTGPDYPHYVNIGIQDDDDGRRQASACRSIWTAPRPRSPARRFA